MGVRALRHLYGYATDTYDGGGAAASVSRSAKCLPASTDGRNAMH